MVKDLFIDLSETPIILDGYVEKEVEDGKTYIKAATTFSDDELSDNDMVVMDDYIEKKHGCIEHSEIGFNCYYL